VVDANSVVVVLPKISAPAARSVIIGAASTRLAGSSLYIGELWAVGISDSICELDFLHFKGKRPGLL
jgi:hypothetical protein